jgi:16S rRNA (cytosine967-C5)-methyltransferase
MTDARATAPDDGLAARRAALHLIGQATGSQRLLSESIAAGGGGGGGRAAAAWSCDL